VFNNEVLFAGLDASGNNGLWVTNGTAAGTSELTGISGAFAGGILRYGGDLTVFNNEVLFGGIDASGVNGLWVTNGTAVGTYELTGISGARSNGIFNFSADGLPDFTVFNNEVLFAGLDASGNNGLWVTNGTAAGTYELTGISGASPTGLSPSDLIVFSNEVLLAGKDASGQVGLWVTNGTAAGTHELTGISGVHSSGVEPSAILFL
jgi:ELWxxDGT repeat protein